MSEVKPVTMTDDGGFEFEVYHASDYIALRAERDRLAKDHDTMRVALIEALHDFINVIVGGCTCGTKPPDPELHELSCHYRMAERGLDGVTKALAAVGALDAALKSEAL